jgi:hypothetical protein
MIYLQGSAGFGWKKSRICNCSRCTWQGTQDKKIMLAVQIPDPMPDLARNVVISLF